MELAADIQVMAAAGVVVAIWGPTSYVLAGEIVSFESVTRNFLLKKPKNPTYTLAIQDCEDFLTLRPKTNKNGSPLCFQQQATV